MKLSEPQKRALRTMVEFDCLLHASEGYCWYGGRAVKEWPRRKARLTTVQALIKRGLVEEKEWEEDQPYWRRDFALTPKGREVAKELQDDPG